MFHILFPQNGTLTLTPGMGWGGLKITKSHKNQIVRKLFTLLGRFSKNVNKNQKHFLNMFLYTEKHTESDKSLKITVYNVKHTKNTKMYFEKTKK